MTGNSDFSGRIDEYNGEEVVVFKIRPDIGQFFHYQMEKMK